MKSPNLADGQTCTAQLASLGPSGESETKPRLSLLCSEPAIELLHELNNAFAVVVMNAQALDSKLPSYSRAKRYLHEIERSAQRGEALLKRLLQRLAADESGLSADALHQEWLPPVAERAEVVANQSQDACAEGVLSFAPSVPSNQARPVRGAEQGSHGCVTAALVCTSRKGTD